MSEEPATRHFTSAELASFLHELELAHPDVHPDSGRLPLPLGLSSLPHPRDHGRARCVMPPQSERLRARSGGRTGGLVPLTRPRFARAPEGALRHQPGGRRALPVGVMARRASLALLVCAGLAAMVWGLFALRSSLAFTVRPRRILMPPPLPSRPAPPPARDQTCDVPAYAGPVAPSQPVQADDSKPLATGVRGQARPLELGVLTAVGDARASVGSRARPLPTFHEVLRREAVELLLSGRTREALEAYRALPASLSTPAVFEVVRHLERELATCAERAGTACGSH